MRLNLTASYNKARDYTLFGMEADFYLQPLVKFQADSDDEANITASKWMVDSDIIFRLYRVYGSGAFFLGCWHFSVQLNDDEFLETYRRTFNRKKIT